MMQVARLAPRLLGDSCGLVIDFLRGQQSADGGFKDRSGSSDLYYTVFGLEALTALQADMPAAAIAGYLRGFGDGDGLDFVHLTCLARCWAGLPPTLYAEAPCAAVLERIEAHRSRDGGYHSLPDQNTGTVYACFLALGAYQDCGAEMPPDAAGMLRCVDSLKTDDGGYANQEDMGMGLTPSTAAAVTLLRQLGDRSADASSVAQWLRERHHPGGGFYATPLAPIPDLLSTATALHALSGLGADLEDMKDSCLDFIDSLWTNKGGFYGSWADDAADCEYTYYALLALGHLAL